MKICFFVHSIVSDWNHGNAHFLRGLATALVAMGHEVCSYEEAGAWSYRNLVEQEPEKADSAVKQFHSAYPDIEVRFYRNDSHFPVFAEKELDGVDLVIVHEWNAPEVVNEILALKRKCGFKVLFHDTHHRAYTNPREIRRFNLEAFDGVLAFGEAVRRIYLQAFGVPRVWCFHEAADVQKFYPRKDEALADVAWVGNWGDDERTRELEEFLIEPTMRSRYRVVVHGVRYPAHAIERLSKAGISFQGYLPNLQAPRVYSQSKISLHIPRRQYSNGLSGVPTIRVFEALACGAVLMCSPWEDAEGLFRPGQDYIVAADGKAMEAEILRLLRDDSARYQIAQNGLETIR